MTLNQLFFFIELWILPQHLKRNFNSNATLVENYGCLVEHLISELWPFSAIYTLRCIWGIHCTCQAIKKLQAINIYDALKNVVIVIFITFREECFCFFWVYQKISCRASNAKILSHVKKPFTGKKLKVENDLSSLDY